MQPVLEHDTQTNGSTPALAEEEPIALAESDSALEGRFVATVPSFSFGGFLVDASSSFSAAITMPLYRST